MPRIPQETIERVREATDIVAVISDYVQLRKAGRNFVGLCPFHAEKTPSFSVNPDLQIYKCFGCGAGGHVFKFIQEVDRVSFAEAVAHLAQRSGIPLPAASQERHDELSDHLYRASELAMKYFHHLLRQPQSREALAYFHARGLTDALIDRFGLGYALPEWDAFFKLASRRQFSPAVLESAGLAMPRKEGGGHYDRFRDRLIFPIANLSGRTIAFGARALRPDQQPKYLNSPETPIYRKSSVLYGLHQAREAIRQQDCALIVEGYMDFLGLVQHGIDHVVASAGTALTEEHCRLLSRFARRVVLLFDGDAAGSAAALRGIEVLLATGLEALAVSLPAGHDPDTFVRAEGPQALLALMENARSALDFHLDQLARQHDLGTLAGKARAAEAVEALLARCRDAVRRDLLLRAAAQRLGIDERAFRHELHQTLRQQGARPPRETAVPPAPRRELPGPEKTFLGLLLQYPRFIAPTAEALSPEAFSDPRAQRLARELFEHHRQAQTLDLPLLMSRIADEEVVQLIPACAMEHLNEAQAKHAWETSLLYFQRNDLKRQIAQINRAMGEADKAQNEAEVKRLQVEASRLRRLQATLEQEQAS